MAAEYVEISDLNSPVAELKVYHIHQRKYRWRVFAFAALNSALLSLFIINLYNRYSIEYSKGNSKRTKILLVSFDGFRADYLDIFDQNSTFAFDRIARSGIRSTRLLPCFPSKTFPNHLSIITGLYPESHGIVSNVFHDPFLNDTFKYWLPEYSNNGVWYSGDPIWSTAVRNGLGSAAMFWPGSEAEIAGYRPTIYLPYSQSQNMSTVDRFDLALKWLKLPDIHLVTVYISFVDEIGHHYGPDAPEMADAVKETNESLNYLIEQMIRQELDHLIDLLVVSDHGMAALDPQKSFNITNIIDISTITIVENSPNTMIIPKNLSHTVDIFNILNDNLDANYHVHLKEEVPPRYHYRDNPRISPIIIEPLLPYVVIIDDNNPALKQKGNHGFDNLDPNMAGIFLAMGPSFKSNVLISDIKNIELYALMAHILKIPASPNNSTDHGHNLLKSGLL